MTPVRCLTRSAGEHLFSLLATEEWPRDYQLPSINLSLWFFILTWLIVLYFLNKWYNHIFVNYEVSYLPRCINCSSKNFYFVSPTSLLDHLHSSIPLVYMGFITVYAEILTVFYFLNLNLPQFYLDDYEDFAMLLLNHEQWSLMGICSAKMQQMV